MVNAGRNSSGQSPRPSSACPISSCRITASCSAPEIRRRDWLLCWRSRLNASECTERTTGSCVIKPLEASRSESSARIDDAASFDAVTMRTPLAAAPAGSAAMALTAVSMRKLEIPEPASPRSFHNPSVGNAGRPSTSGRTVSQVRISARRGRGSKTALGVTTGGVELMQLCCHTNLT